MIKQHHKPNRLIGSETSSAHVQAPQTSLPNPADLTANTTHNAFKLPLSISHSPQTPVASLLESPEMNGNERGFPKIPAIPLQYSILSILFIKLKNSHQR